MELKYPVIMIIGICLYVFIFLLPTAISKIKHKKVDIANTFVVKNTDIYKNIIFRYRIGICSVFILMLISILACSLLSSRIVETKIVDNKIYNRDIMLCMDVSTSVAELNESIIDSYKNVIKSLKGERFGISIFNTNSYLFVPLTDDYDYINKKLDELHDGFKEVLTYGDPNNVPMIVYEKHFSGTILVDDNLARGSSLIGDGLASCVYDFPTLDDDRSRIIIFSTDNDMVPPRTKEKAEPLIEVIPAAKLAKSKEITVYSLAPDFIKEDNAKELKEATKITKGNYYLFDKKNNNVRNIVHEIEKHEKHMMEGDKHIETTDFPEIPFLILAISFLLLIIIEKVILL
jgi:hypothetical protein